MSRGADYAQRPMRVRSGWYRAGRWRKVHVVELNVSLTGTEIIFETHIPFQEKTDVLGSNVEPPSTIDTFFDLNAFADDDRCHVDLLALLSGSTIGTKVSAAKNCGCAICGSLSGIVRVDNLYSCAGAFMSSARKVVRR